MELMHLENFNAAEFLHCLLLPRLCAAWHCSFVEIEIISVMIIALINYLEMTAFVIKRQLSHTFFNLL